jgi:ABC-2 type transport system ATP-binding protein
VLILDEPANGLDPAGVAQVSGLLRRLQVDGVSVLLSSHDLDQVEDLCDEITVLRRGVVAYQGSVEDLRRAAPAPTVLISTSDDERAVAVGGRLPQVHVRHRPGSHGAGTSGSLLVKGGLADVDGYVVQLGRSGIAVRAMSVERTSLHAAFLALTVDTDPAGDEQPQAPTAGRKPRRAVVMAPGASS